MPIVSVEVVVGANDAMAQDFVQSLADAIGRALKSPAGQTWVRVRSLARDRSSDRVRTHRVRTGCSRPSFVRWRPRSMIMLPNISLNPDASPAALTRRPLGA